MHLWRLAVAKNDVQLYADRTAPELSARAVDEVVKVAEELSSMGLSSYDAVDCLAELVGRPDLIARLAAVAEEKR
jgi:hypothetical protein